MGSSLRELILNFIFDILALAWIWRVEEILGEWQNKGGCETGLNETMNGN